MRRVRIAALSLLGVLVAGTLGYMLIERWSLLDSVYMTVITVATVGFREVHVLSDAGQWFTIALIFAGVGGMSELKSIIGVTHTGLAYALFLAAMLTLGASTFVLIKRLEKH